LWGEYFPGPGKCFFLLISFLVEFPMVALGLDLFYVNMLLFKYSLDPGPGFLLIAILFLKPVPIEKLGNFVPVKIWLYETLYAPTPGM
jgi:hypothetical protein